MTINNPQEVLNIEQDWLKQAQKQAKEFQSENDILVGDILAVIDNYGVLLAKVTKKTIFGIQVDIPQKIEKYGITDFQQAFFLFAELKNQNIYALSNNKEAPWFHHYIGEIVQLPWNYYNAIVKGTITQFLQDGAIDIACTLPDGSKIHQICRPEEINQPQDTSEVDNKQKELAAELARFSHFTHLDLSNCPIIKLGRRNKKR